MNFVFKHHVQKQCHIFVRKIEFCKKYPTAVIHTIAGITTQEQYKSLMDKKTLLETDISNLNKTIEEETNRATNIIKKNT